MTLERELRDTSDSLMRALDQLRDLEAEKRGVPTGSRRFVELAQRVEDLAIEVLRRTEELATRTRSVAREELDKHRAENRMIFARGALAAVRFLVGKPAGLYSMRDVVEEL